MGRRLRWLLLALAVVVVAGIVAAVVIVQPKLSDARDRVDKAWSPLRPALDARYRALAGVELQLDAAGQANRTVTVQLHDTLTSWEKLANVDDPGAQAPIANDLEALALRLKANVAASAKLRADQPLGASIAAFDRAVVSPPGVAAYNAAVRAYQQERTGAIHHLVAAVFGYGARPELVIAGA